jgi:hypothetical protein
MHTFVLLYVLLSFYNVNCEPVIISPDPSALLVQGSNYLVCSSNDFCQAIKEFTVTNDNSRLINNHNSVVKIKFKVAPKQINDTKVDAVGYLHQWGAVSNTPGLEVEDSRRTKT